MLVTCSSDICVTVTSQSYVVLYMCVKPDPPPQQLLSKTSSSMCWQVATALETSDWLWNILVPKILEFQKDILKNLLEKAFWKILWRKSILTNIRLTKNKNILEKNILRESHLGASNFERNPFEKHILKESYFEKKGTFWKRPFRKKK